MTQGVSTLALPVKVTAAVTANRFISVAGAHAAAADIAYGVGRTTAAIAETITVTVNGTEVVEAGGAFAVGAIIGSDATGRAITATGVKRGIALQASTAAGQLVEVFLVPALA